jgi:hypothetical protein
VFAFTRYVPCDTGTNKEYAPAWSLVLSGCWEHGFWFGRCLCSNYR